MPTITTSQPGLDDGCAVVDGARTGLYLVMTEDACDANTSSALAKVVKGKSDAAVLGGKVHTPRQSTRWA
ncbi:MAG: hypothetical protein IPH37_19970 [Burkholderiales bacterium]|nr:hypothetical protein [Burkholderiales bacterium]